MEITTGGAKRPAEAAAYLGVKMTKFWWLVKNEPQFPRPLKVSTKVTLFLTAELDEYLSRLAQLRTSGASRAPSPKPDSKFAELRNRPKRPLRANAAVEHS